MDATSSCFVNTLQNHFCLIQKGAAQTNMPSPENRGFKGKESASHPTSLLLVKSECLN